MIYVIISIGASMKALLQFNLPEEKSDHLDALNGSSFKYILQDFDNLLRQKLKHGDHPDEVSLVLQELREYLNGAVNERGMSIWD
jgi:hypothetical protein